MGNITRGSHFFVWVIAGIAWTLSSVSGMAQTKQYASWKINAVRLKDNDVTIMFFATLDSGWHLYAQHVRISQVALKFSFNDSDQYSRSEGVREESKPVFRFDPFFNQAINRFENSAAFSQVIKVASTNAIVNGTIEFTVGSDGEQPVKEVLHFSVAVSVKNAKEKVVSN